MHGSNRKTIPTCLTGTPTPFQLSALSHIFGESMVFVHLQWVQRLKRGLTTYSLEVEPTVDEALLTDTNILVYIPYNTRYIANVTARNCEGSTSAYRELYFGKKNSECSNLFYTPCIIIL